MGGFSLCSSCVRQGLYGISFKLCLGGLAVLIDDNEILKIVLSDIQKVMKFSPYKKFVGIKNRQEFGELIARDPAFGHLGLADDRYLVARVGGNLVTSLHRKLGDMYERIFSYLLRETYNVAAEDVHYSVEVMIGDRVQLRSTDGVIRPENYGDMIPENWKNSEGIGFEVRSCYQIGDSKRIQADYDMALKLKAAGIVPVMLIMCATSLRSPVSRLAKSWDLYEGKQSFALIQQLTGYDLASFFTTNEKVIKAEMDKVLSTF